MTKSGDGGTEFLLPNRDIISAIWSSVLTAVMVFTAVQLVIGAGYATDWPTVARLFNGAISGGAACMWASRTRSALRRYRERDDVPRIEQLDRP